MSDAEGAKGAEGGGPSSKSRHTPILGVVTGAYGFVFNGDQVEFAHNSDGYTLTNPDAWSIEPPGDPGSGRIVTVLASGQTQPRPEKELFSMFVHYVEKVRRTDVGVFDVKLLGWNGVPTLNVNLNDPASAWAQWDDALIDLDNETQGWLALGPDFSGYGEWSAGYKYPTDLGGLTGPTSHVFVKFDRKGRMRLFKGHGANQVELKPIGGAKDFPAAEAYLHRCFERTGPDLKGRRGFRNSRQLKPGIQHNYLVSVAWRIANTR